MMIQSLTQGMGGAMPIGQFSGAKAVQRKDNEAKDATTQNAASLDLSPKSQYAKMTENIQKQMQSIRESDAYDDETKQSKLEELQKQLEELQAAQAAQTNETAAEKAKKEAEKDSANAQKYTSADGDTVELSMNMESLIKADNGMKNLEDAHSQKVRAEGSSRVLASEIKTDQGRGVDTTKKEEELAKTEASANAALKNMGEAVQSTQEAASDIAETSGAPNAVTNEKAADDTSAEQQMEQPTEQPKQPLEN